MFIKGMIKDCYLAKQPKITDNTYNVSITGNTDEEILYTVDGTDPIINGIVYKAPFRVDKDCIVEARTVNEWSHSSSAFADVKKSKTEIKPLTTRYQDMRLKGEAAALYQSPFYFQYGVGGYNEWTLFLCISHCISLNANIYTATYTTASGNTQGFKISVKNGDLYFDVYREGVIDESFVLSSGFGIEGTRNLTSPAKIQYLIINSKGQINGEQKFKPIITNKKPTFETGSYAYIGDTDLVFGLADYCIYSGIKEELEGFHITEENTKKVEFSIDKSKKGVQMKARGNIYYDCTDSGMKDDTEPVLPKRSFLYTNNEDVYGANYTDIQHVRYYAATAYCGDGSIPVKSSTTALVFPPTKVINQELNSSNLTGEKRVYESQNDETIFLQYHNFVPTEMNQEVSLFKIYKPMPGGGGYNFVYDITLTPGYNTGFQLYNYNYEAIAQLQKYDTVNPSDFIVAINKEKLSIYTYLNSNYELREVALDDMPSTKTIYLSAPSVNLDSEWAIKYIAVSEYGKLNAEGISIYMFGYLPYEPYNPQ